MFQFENEYDTSRGIRFANEYSVLPVGICATYLASCYLGQMYMADKKAMDLKTPLALWNLFLSTFSFIGMFKTVPHLLYNLHTMTLTENLCREARYTFGGKGSCGLWVQLFIFSKIPELLDTAFIVARKKPLIFLHWYHHVSVLLFCWHSYATEASTGLFFVAMNYSVHAVMYGYYFLMAVDAKPKWLKPMWITIGQISQMIVGTSLCLMSFALLQKGETQCDVRKENVIAGGVMYGSYLYLFCKFAMEKSVDRPKKKIV
jgi:elongation of very long chain fatty acids protein 6